MINILWAVLSAYIMAVVITSGSLFESSRAWFKRKTVGTICDKKPKHFIECRLCITFWTALVTAPFVGFEYLLPVYGLAYFLATQERN